MPWHIAEHTVCPPSRPHAVIQDNNGHVMGCHATEADAKKQMAALYGIQVLIDVVDNIIGDLELTPAKARQLHHAIAAAKRAL